MFFIKAVLLGNIGNELLIKQYLLTDALFVKRRYKNGYIKPPFTKATNNRFGSHFVNGKLNTRIFLCERLHKQRQQIRCESWYDPHFQLTLVCALALFN